MSIFKYLIFNLIFNKRVTICSQNSWKVNLNHCGQCYNNNTKLKLKNTAKTALV